MRKEKINFIFGLCFVLGLATFTSCSDDDNDPELLREAQTDAFVQKRVIDDEEKTAVSFFVWANCDLKSVTVTAPGEEGKTYTLKADANNSQVFRFMPSAEDFSAEAIVTGDYSFKLTGATSSADTLNQNDALTDADLAKVEIASTEFESSKLKTTWETVADNEGYVLTLFDSEDNILFIKEIDSEATEFSFGTSDEGWLSETKAVSEEEYKVELGAILYEADSNDGNKDYNIQHISYATKTITWE